MVGPMLLLKMLHCKRKRMKDKTSTEEESAGEGPSHGEKLRESRTKDIKKEKNDDNTCRVCLKEGNVPIYGDNPLEDISEALYTIGGIEVRIDDPYPKYLCHSCNALLQGAVLFRKTAQQSDELLKHPSKNIKEDIKEDINDDTFNDFNDDQDSTEYEVHKDKKKRRTYNCKTCEISFDKFKDYNEHKLSEEHENMRRVCSICNKSYSARYFKRHLAFHKQESPYMCDVCGKNFVMQGQFSRHRLTHFYKLPFQCSLCPYKGRFSESLKMHMRSHTGEKPYHCTQCPSRFISKSNLNKHMLTHRGEHDFKCDTCGRGFYTRRELESHYKVDHTGIKDHVCSICGKAFGYRKQMMKHQLRVHKREKLRSGRMPLYLQVETMQQQGKEVSAETKKI